MKKFFIIAIGVLSVTMFSCRHNSSDTNKDEADEDTIDYKLNLDALNQPENQKDNTGVPAPDAESVTSVSAPEIALVEGESTVEDVAAQKSRPAKENKRTAEVAAPAAVDAPAAEVKAQEHKTSGDQTLDLPMVEQRPTFPGGDAALYRWLASHLNYPNDAAEQGISGKVIVSFIIKKDGSISSVRVLRSKHPSLDAEALRVVRSMPKWTPGRNNGEPVNVRYSLPINFRLQ